jgi:hypothetical protein
VKRDATALAFAIFILSHFICTAASAQYASFGRSTDTIQVAGHTVLGSTATFEARVLSYSAPGGLIFNEFTNGQEDKQFGLASLLPVGFAFPHGSVVFVAPIPTSVLNWHHIAFVHTASDERLYVDGSQVAVRLFGGDVGDGAGVSSASSVGAISRVGVIFNSFHGLIDTLRISNNARYAGLSFSPPSGDLSNDSATVLLYNFGESAGSATITDLSGNGHTGTLGAGFVGASSPTLGLGSVPAGQSNSADARLEFNGLGSGTATGPFPVLVASGGSMSFTWTGPPGMPFVLAYGPLNPGGAAVPCIGSIDIGTPPFFSDVGILFDGTQAGYGFLFTLNTLGASSQTFSLPALPPGILTTLQGLVFQPSSNPCPVVATAAFVIQII